MKYIIFSVDLEEWFHSEWFDSRSLLSRYYGQSPVTDIETSTKQLLKLFDSSSVTATFFSLLSTCNKYPGLVEDICGSNHEIGIHGNQHEGVIHLGQTKFKEELRYAKHEMETLSGQRMLGYRAPNFEITDEAIRIIAETGFLYDSSINPCIKIPGWYGSSAYPTDPYKHSFQNRGGRVEPGLIEFPLSVFPVFRFPGCGGWYLRNFGITWVKLLLQLHLKTHDTAVVYIHPWELSNNNPMLPEIPFHVFRRTGTWTFNALKSIIAMFQNQVSFTSFRNYLEDVGVE